MEETERSSKNLQVVLIVLLFIIRFLLTYFPNLKLYSIPSILNYAIIGLLFILNKEKLEPFHISNGFLVLFFLSPLWAVLAGPGNFFLVLLMAVVVIAIAMGLFRKKEDGVKALSVRKTAWKGQYFAYVAIGWVIMALAGFLLAGAKTETFLYNFHIVTILSGLFTCSNVDPFFWGFIFRYLKEKNLNIVLIGVITALLYWVSNIPLLLTGASRVFWIMVPLMALISSYITIKTEDLFYTSLFNTFALILIVAGIAS